MTTRARTREGCEGLDYVVKHDGCYCRNQCWGWG